MLFLKIIFFLSCFIVLYNYAGYAIIVVLFNKFFKRKKIADSASASLPTVSFIVAAYNEQDCMRQKIENSLQQNYPAHRIEYIFITDGSTDNTPNIVKEYSQVKLLHSDQRAGKSAALNRAVSLANNNILIFSDANTNLNVDAVMNIAKHYADPNTGGVAGEKKVLKASENEVGGSEGLYWKYESFLKKIDSEFYSVVGAAGELFSVRKELYEPIQNNIILDDFVISLKIAKRGYRIQYEPNAYASELPSFSLKEEEKRKIRISAGAFQAMAILKSLFKFWKQPRLSFLYISHRVLRWTLTPLSLIIAFISNAVLFFYSDHPFFKITFVAQLLFYGFAFLGGAFPSQTKNIKLVKLAYYFVFMNISVIRGFFRYMKGSQSASWEKAKRYQTNPS